MCKCVYVFVCMRTRKSWLVFACYNIVLGEHANNLEHVFVKLTVYIPQKEKKYLLIKL